MADGRGRVEQVTGRMGYGKAALPGALQGALLGALFGWLFGLFNWVDPVISSLTLALYGLVIGAVVGVEEALELGHAHHRHLHRLLTAVVYPYSRYSCTRRTAMAASPTAEATRLIDPLRTSPAANTPGRLVSSRNGWR